MSIQFNTLMLQYNGTQENYNAAYTITGWFYPVDTGTTRNLFSTSLNAGGNEDYVGLDGAGHLRIGVRIAFAENDGDAATTYSINEWHFFALRRTSATAISLFYDDAALITGPTNDVTSRTAADRFVVGRSLDNGVYFNGQMTQMRIWQSALSDTEVRTERDSPTIVKATPWTNYIMSIGTDQGDASDNGHDLFENVGTGVTGASNPTQPFGGPPAGFMWL